MLQKNIHLIWFDLVFQEYGISQDDRLTISKSTCHKFFKKIKGDLQYNVNQDTVFRLDPR